MNPSGDYTVHFADPDMYVYLVTSALVQALNDT